MYVYTVKLILNPLAHEDMVKYLYNIHLPDVVNTGCFLSFTLEVDTTNNEVIARYQCVSTEQFQNYLNKFANNLRQEVIDKFPNGIVSATRNFCKVISQ
ncbi:MAG: DUF4286 family protein [Burkholderiales bacterium]|nr:DUF4286 family protein [Burkholderiales bacterium]